MKEVKVAIVGATGAVGLELIDLLAEEVSGGVTFSLFASKDACVTRLSGKYPVSKFDPPKMRDFHVVFFCVSGDFSKEYAHRLVEAGSDLGPNYPIIIDNSSHFRMAPKVPLVIPEINGDTVWVSKGVSSRIIANPNCTTAILALPLAVIHETNPLKAVLVYTYQAASGAGEKGTTELKTRTLDCLMEKPQSSPQAFGHPLEFNVIPQIDKFTDNGYTKEEMKVTNELQKIMGWKSSDDNPAEVPHVGVACTAVRVPTLRAHSMSVTTYHNLEVVPANIAGALQLESSPTTFLVKDDLDNLEYPMPIHVSHKKFVEIGRIRKNLVDPQMLDFFVSGDHLLRGAALNAFYILKELMEGWAETPEWQ